MHTRDFYLFRMLRMYKKTEDMIDLLYEFTTRQWKFDNSNTRELWLSLSKEDRNMFFYSLDDFDWKSYIKNYYYGIRKYILHEDSSNIEKSLAKNRKYGFNGINGFFFVFIYCVIFRLYWLHQLSIFLAANFVLQLLWMLLKYLL